MAGARVLDLILYPPHEEALRSNRFGLIGKTGIFKALFRLNKDVVNCFYHFQLSLFRNALKVSE